MSKLNLCVLDSDNRYTENLAGYVTQHYRHRFNVLTFSDTDSFLGYTGQKSSRADIVLISSEMLGDWVKKLDGGLIIQMVGCAAADSCSAGCAASINGTAEGAVSGGTAADIGAIPSVGKYSGAERLIGDILRIYSAGEQGARDTDTVAGRRDSKLTAVFSPDGGVGRTTAALALCEMFARQKLRTLYIDLDWTGAFGIPAAGGTADGMSDIIYTLKSRPERLGIKLEALARLMPGAGFYYFEPTIYPMDADELTPRDLEILIAKLRGIGVYDRVVIDTHSGLSLRNMTLLEHADCNLIMSSLSESGFGKLTLFKSQIDRYFSTGSPGTSGSNGSAGATGSADADWILKRVQLLLNNCYAADASFTASCGISDRMTDYDAVSRISAEEEHRRGLIHELSLLYQAKCVVLPFREYIRGKYQTDMLVSVTRGIGASISEVAHNI